MKTTTKIIEEFLRKGIAKDITEEKKARKGLSRVLFSRNSNNYKKAMLLVDKENNLYVTLNNNFLYM